MLVGQRSLFARNPLRNPRLPGQRKIVCNFLIAERGKQIGIYHTLDYRPVGERFILNFEDHVVKRVGLAHQLLHVPFLISENVAVFKRVDLLSINRVRAVHVVHRIENAQIQLHVSVL